MLVRAAVDSYIHRMTRVLLLLLLAWVAIAPALASACAAGCEMGAAEHSDHNPAVSGMDCHGSQTSADAPGPLDPPDSAMAAGCLVAATASIAAPVIATDSIWLRPEHPLSIPVLPSSRSPAPPDKPPRA